MRITCLKRTTTGIILVIAGIVLTLGTLRAVVMTPQQVSTEQGQALFDEKGCSQCHYAYRRQTKMGPGLKGLFERENLPVSGRPATEKNVRRQLETPYKDMPSFADKLDPDQVELLIAYLKTL